MLKRLLKGSSDMSLPQARTIHGIEVKKVPVGKYISSMQEIQDLPQTIITACFPEDESLRDVVDKTRDADSNYVLDLVGRLLTGIPGVIIELAATLLEVEEDVLLGLTPVELMDVLEGWWELNDLTDFFKRVWGKIKPLIASYQTPEAGSNAG